MRLQHYDTVVLQIPFREEKAKGVGKMSSVLFSAIMQLMVVIHCGHFGPTYRSVLQGSNNPRRKSWIAWPCCTIHYI